MSDVIELRPGDRHPVPDGIDRPSVDRLRAEAAARELLEALAVDVADESTRDTPRRLVDVYAELLSPAPFNPTTFPNDGGYDELVVARAIPFHSLCAHHLLPFVGVAHVGYLPGERIRAVEARSGRRLLRPLGAGAGAPDDADRGLAGARVAP
jgi:GTP cyclohydrolase I